MRFKLASLVSEIFAPWVINILFFITLGFITTAWPPAMAAALGTGVIPMAIILGLMKRGSVGNHHVTTRGHRGQVFAGIILSVVGLLIVLAFLDTPWLIWGSVWSALIFLMIFAAVTLVGKRKASVHTGLWNCLGILLAIAVSPWWALALVFTPVIAWGRIAVNHHTFSEVCLGALTGVTVGAVCATIFF